MNQKRAWFLPVWLVVAGTAACGGEVETIASDSRASTDWLRVEQKYPFVGEDGEFVCNEWTRKTEDGLTQVDREYYHLDKINDKLAGRIDIGTGAREFIQSKGLINVNTCHQARDFMRLQHEYLESFPSKEPDAEILPGDRAAEDIPADRMDKVREGTFYDHVKTVRLRRWTATNKNNTCTGSLLNKYAIVTAAHCYPAQGMVSVSVDYGVEFENDPPNGNWCISNNSPNCGTIPSSPNFYVYRNPNFTGEGDTKDDVAILVHWTYNPWSVIGDDSNAYTRILTSLNAQAMQYWVQGYGTNNHNGSGAGTNRRSLRMEGISWVGDGYWLSYATHGYGHPCQGDSGGPAVNTISYPFEMSLGVESNSDKEGDERCPRIGEKFRYASFYNSVNRTTAVNAMNSSGSPPCWNYATGTYSYLQCW